MQAGQRVASFTHERPRPRCADTSSHLLRELTMRTSSQLHVHWYYIRCLKLTVVAYPQHSNLHVREPVVKPLPTHPWAQRGGRGWRTKMTTWANEWVTETTVPIPFCVFLFYFLKCSVFLKSDKMPTDCTPPPTSCWLIQEQMWNALKFQLLIISCESKIKTYLQTT